jgi:alanine racemase
MFKPIQISIAGFKSTSMSRATANCKRGRVFYGRAFMSKYFRPTRLEINLDNLRHNLKEIKRIIDNKTKVCAVVKANGYGMGACQVARVALSEGVSYLAVSTLDEAIELRKDGIDIPVLILGYTPSEHYVEIIKWNLTQAIFDLKSAKVLAYVAKKYQRTAKVHIKIDTGMGRLGFPADMTSIPYIREIYELEGLKIEGIFTHFARAYEEDTGFTKGQFEKFINIVTALENNNISIPIKHVANSPTIVRYPEMHLDMVRPGNLIYGLHPPFVGKDVIHLKPVMSLKTVVAHVKCLPAGSPISYLGTFVTKRDSVIATIPLGYADGYTRLLSNKGFVMIKGEYAPIVGLICMDQCMVDVTDIKGVAVGDEVVVIGEMGEKIISLDDISELTGIIRTEIMTTITNRVPRIYVINC